MRIIAGSARSLPLKTVEGLETRPTSDRIKETLFNMIQNEIPDCHFLDLFAGSGQIGLEALSRGANYAVFVDNGKKPAQCIMDNIQFTKFDKQSTVITMDATAAIRSMEGKYQFNVVFMDPPYNREIEKDILYTLKDSPVLKEGALIIVEASLETDFSYLEEMGYRLLKRKEYKTNMHIFLEKA